MSKKIDKNKQLSVKRQSFDTIDDYKEYLETSFGKVELGEWYDMHDEYMNSQVLKDHHNTAAHPTDLGKMFEQIRTTIPGLYLVKLKEGE